MMRWLTCDDGHDQVFFASRFGEGTGCPACKLLDKRREVGLEDLEEEIVTVSEALDDANGMVASLTAEVDQLKKDLKSKKSARPKKKRA